MRLRARQWHARRAGPRSHACARTPSRTLTLSPIGHPSADPLMRTDRPRSTDDGVRVSDGLVAVAIPAMARVRVAASMEASTGTVTFSPRLGYAQGHAAQEIVVCQVAAKLADEPSAEQRIVRMALIRPEIAASITSWTPPSSTSPSSATCRRTMATARARCLERDRGALEARPGLRRCGEPNS